MPRYGAVDEHQAGNWNTAQQQAASIGATIGPDGWWYKDGQRLSHAQADQLVADAGTAQDNLKDWGSGKGTFRDIYDREPQWLKTLQTFGIDTGNPAIDQKRTMAAAAALGPIMAAGGTTAGLRAGGAASSAATSTGASSVANGTGGGAQGLDWTSLIPIGLNVLGNVISGQGQQKMTKEQIAAQQQQAANALGYSYQGLGQQGSQFAQTSNMERLKLMDERAKAAADAQRQLSLQPLADKAAYYFAQRAGAGVAPFQAPDYTRGTMPGTGTATGGYAPLLAAQQRAMSAYTPGAGGLKSDALEAQLKQYQDQSQLPGMYKPQTGGEMQIAAQIGPLMTKLADLQSQLAGETNGNKRIALMGQIAALQRQIAGYQNAQQQVAAGNRQPPANANTPAYLRSIMPYGA